MSTIFDWFERVTDFILLKPLYKIYKAVWWSGQPQEQICTELNPGTTATFWKEHDSECYNIVYSKFESVHTMVNCGLWICLLYQLYCLGIFVCRYSIESRRHQRMIEDIVETVHVRNQLLDSKLVTQTKKEN